MLFLLIVTSVFCLEVTLLDYANTTINGVRTLGGEYQLFGTTSIAGISLGRIIHITLTGDVIKDSTIITDGNYEILGTNQDFIVEHTSAGNGDIILTGPTWQRTYGNLSRFDRANALCSFGSSAYLAGTSRGFGEESFRQSGLITKISKATGDTLWTTISESSGSSWGKEFLAIAYDARTYASGYDNRNFSDTVVLTCLNSSTGEIEWEITLGNGRGKSVATDYYRLDSDVLVAGQYDSGEAFIARVDNTGDIVWQGTLATGSINAMEFQYGTEGVIVVGQMAGQQWAGIINVNSGEITHSQTFNTGALNKVIISGDDILSVGHTVSYGINYPFLVKIDFTSLGMPEPDNNENESFRAFPNPFNGACQFDSKLNRNFEIYDAKGRLIDTVSKKWNPSDDIAAGMYFARAVGSKASPIKLLYVK